GGAIIIPSTLGGYSVVAIGSNAFKNCTSLTSVTIPNSVTSIGNYAFRECTSLTSVTIPDSVTSIGSYAFYYCTSLTSVTIPNRVTSIGIRAFSTCTSLTSVNIGSGVTSIGSGAFASCTNLTSVTIPNRVTSIGNGAFASCTSLTSVTIPDSVTSIGDIAFRECTSLTSVTIPNSVTTMGYSAFDHCVSLTSVTIGNSVTTIGYRAFDSCTALTSVTIGNSVTTIGYRAFASCTALTSVTIGSGVTSIGDSAFYGCTALTSVTIPNSVTSIETGAFSHCTSLTAVSIPDSVTTIKTDVFVSCTALTSVIIGSGVTTIESYAFWTCKALTSITFRGMVAPISVGYGWKMFTSAAILGHAYAASNFPAPGGNFNGLTMGDCIPEAPGAPTLSSATAGSSVTLVWTAPAGSITGYKVFYGTSSTPTTQFGSTLNASTLTVDVTGLSAETLYYFAVKAVNAAGDSVPSNVLSAQVGDYIYTVSDNPSVATITGYIGAGGAIIIPSTLGGYSVVAIGEPSFYQCTSLTSVIIPNSVTSIASESFTFCTSLTSVTIGSNVWEIDDYALAGCTSLTSITFLGAVAPTLVGNWIVGDPASLRGHAYAASNFPAPGSWFNGLLMGDYIPEVPGAPTVISAIEHENQATLTWTAPLNSSGGLVAGYNVFYGSTATPTTQFDGTHSASTLTVIVTGLTPATTFYFGVKAGITVGDSLFSNVLAGRCNIN
ncbi:MAG: leucine-rich repeat protein, partial [Methanomassiliicoccales archaeon]